jgi:hypothetical protein
MSKPVLTRFPFINLAKSLERGKAIFENDKGGKGLKMPVAFSAWGYSDKSSGGFQTVAALKAYGLLEDEGANDDRSVKLTMEARQYCQSGLDDDRAKLCENFAARPPLMSHLLEHWGRGTVADPVARTYLKTGVGLNEQSARSALGIYKDNLSFISSKGLVKGADAAGEPSTNEDDRDASFGNARVGDLIDYEVGGTIANPSPLRVRALSPDQAWVFVDGSETGLEMANVIVKNSAANFPPQVVMDQAFGKRPVPTLPLPLPEPHPTAAIEPSKGYRSETFDTDEGAIKITWPDNLSPQSVEDMHAWVSLLMKRVERRANTFKENS